MTRASFKDTSGSSVNRAESTVSEYSLSTDCNSSFFMNDNAVVVAWLLEINGFVETSVTYLKCL